MCRHILAWGCPSHCWDWAEENRDGQGPCGTLWTPMKGSCHPQWTAAPLQCHTVLPVHPRVPSPSAAFSGVIPKGPELKTGLAVRPPDASPGHRVLSSNNRCYYEQPVSYKQGTLPLCTLRARLGLYAQPSANHGESSISVTASSCPWVSAMAAGLGVVRAWQLIVPSIHYSALITCCALYLI